ncbi:MAG: hypothetical protein Q4B64_00410 [Spirochaetales bacterium]|nr:hypothetical protein [Spirochaetales bacterium]
MCNIKRTTKDSVFTALFSHKEYALQLFKVLHPEEKNVTEKDIEIITIDNVLTDGIYNDLGLMFKDRLIILAEAQSCWNGNMAIRSLLYLSETYKRYLAKKRISLFTSSTVELPVPEMYVIFTGEKSDHPAQIKLEDHFPDDTVSPLQLNVKMIYDSKEGDIIYQYINFCKVFDQMRRDFPDSVVMAVKNTITICRNKELLAEFLRDHETELNDIMYDFLYNEEYWRKLMLRDERKKAREEGLAEGRADGRAEGRAEGLTEGLSEGRLQGAHDKAVEMAKKMLDKDMAINDIADLTGLTSEEVTQLANLES